MWYQKGLAMCHLPIIVSTLFLTSALLAQPDEITRRDLKTFRAPKRISASSFYYDGKVPLAASVPKVSGSNVWDGLDEFASRSRTRSYPNPNTYLCERIIFRDKVTHGEKWLLTRWDGRHDYSTLLAFNANGSLIKSQYYYDLTTSRRARLKQTAYTWDRVQPDVMYGWRRVSGSGQAMVGKIYRVNVLTGERTDLCETKGPSQLWPPSDDGKRVLWREGGPKGKGFVLGTVGPNGEDPRKVNARGGIHQMYFLRTGKYDVHVRRHTRVDEKGRLIDARKGGTIIVNATTGEARRGGFGGKHEAISALGHWVSFSGFTISNELGIVPPPGWKGSGNPFGKHDHRAFKLVDATEEHTTWTGFDVDWGAISVNTQYGSGIIKFNAATSDVMLLCSANQRPPNVVNWGTCQFANQSPDSTKTLFMSSQFLGRHEFISVSRRPNPPTGVRVEKVAEGYRIQWKPAQLSRETRGYHVLRSSRSGGGYSVVSSGPINGTEFLDRSAPPGPLFYTVRSQEFSGLVSPPGEEASANAAGLPHSIHLEAESGKNTAPLRVTYDGRYSGSHIVRMARSDAKNPGTLTVDFSVPAKGLYHVWLRARSELPASIETSVAGKTGGLRIEPGPASWHRLSDAVEAEKGKLSLSLKAWTRTVLLDKLILTSDTGFVPKGLGKIDAQPPAPPENLKNSATGSKHVDLTWTRSPDRDLSHTNVYCSKRADFICKQANLILSPQAADTTCRDWGLAPGTAYYYRITAVDWDGNESQPTPPIEVKTQ
ncbi:MAG: fibronectin type III domain-containing protein [Planctomycetota bacterium]|jgi:hypothetical protein|nr:fibronectin type III domain-containing protein [Planctomycetota bacterium]